MSWAKVFELWSKLKVDTNGSPNAESLILEQRKKSEGEVKRPKKGVNKT